MIPFPEISPEFTIDDIHKIREYNYEVTKGMSVEERVAYYSTPRTDAHACITEARRKYLETNGENET